MKTISLLLVVTMFLTMWGYVINKMVTSGKIKAKGAKKRRRKILPFFFKKKKKENNLIDFDEIG